MTNTPAAIRWIDRTSIVPLFEQICSGLRARIASGDLRKGTNLPPTRALATELGVSRSTVVTAYEQLVAEGYLHGVQGSGFVVLALGKVELSPHNTIRPKKTAMPTASPVRPFQGGQPDMRLFPHQKWAQALSRVCRKQPHALLSGTGGFGNLDLRMAIAEHVHQWRGIKAGAEQVIITAGSTDALEICSRILAQRGDRIGLEDPGYLPLRRFAEKQGLTPLNLKIDADGAILPSSAKGVRLVVLTPSHQYPLGGAMPPARRLGFIRWAEQNDIWIIEDDYDSEFRYAGQPIPAMAGFDRLNRTIYVGSFSKIFSNTLRLGYIIIPETLLSAFQSSIVDIGTKASAVPQQALAEFMQAGEFYRHLRRVRRIYDERRRFLLDRLASDFSEYGVFSDHQAGMQITFHLNPKWPDKQISHSARERGIITPALSDFCVSQTDLNAILLGFCGYSTTEIATALEALKKTFQDQNLRTFSQ